MKTLTSFFVHRPLLVRLMMIFIFIAGTLSLKFHTYEMFPTVDLGIATITTYRPGASPEDMEVSITIPLEDELLDVDGIEKIFSSSMEGMSVITIRMDPDVKDSKQVLADIQKAIDRGATKLPSDLHQQPLVEELSTRTIPVIEIHVNGSAPEEVLRKTADLVSDGLREVEGVASVDKIGFRTKEVKIFVDPERLMHLGISYNEMISAIQNRNVRDSGGSIDSFLLEKKVLTIGQFSRPKEVAEVIIRQGRSVGNLVRMRDVADVILDYEDWQERSFIDGIPSILVLPKKKPSADGIKTVAAIREFIQKTQKNIPPGVELVLVNDLTRFTFDMLDVLGSNAILGLILLFCVLLLFFNLRLAFWVSVGLPVSILLTLLVMPLFNMGINVMTLTVFILLLGMLVDDAIVTGESIYSEREQGVDPKTAAINGRSVVAGPVIVSTLTTILAFAPVAFLGGLEGKFMWYFPAMVSIILLASLVECQFMLPSHLTHEKKIPQPKKWFIHFQNVYDRFILKLIKRRFLSILLFVVIVVLIITLGIFSLKFNLYPETDIDTFNIKIELPEGTSFQYTTQKTLELEELVREVVPKEDLLNIGVKVGQHDTDFYGAVEGRNPAWALMTVYMLPQGQRKTNSNTIIHQLREDFKTTPGFQSLIVEPLKDTPVAGKPVELELIGNDPGRYEMKDLIVAYLKQYPGAQDVWTSYKPGKQIIELKINHALMASRGLTTTDVTQAVRIAFDGAIVDELQTVDDEIRYRLQFRPQQKGRLETLKNLFVINQQGKAIPIRSFVDFVTRPGEATIKHYLGQRTITIYAEIDRKIVDVKKINTDLENYIQNDQLLHRFPGMRYWLGGELEQQKAAMGSIQVAFLICILSIFFILVILFNSMTQPFLIMIVIPFGITGVILGFAIQGIEMSMIALIGILGLIGVLVNDSLVMVDNINRIKKRKQTSGPQVKFLEDEDIAIGAGQRLRPIVITSLTTCAGLFPTAYGIAGSNPFITPMVMAMLWGILFGTFVSLILLPCLYAADQDIKKKLSNSILKIRKWKYHD